VAVVAGARCLLPPVEGEGEGAEKVREWAAAAAAAAAVAAGTGADAGSGAPVAKAYRKALQEGCCCMRNQSCTG
jgi:hypothetical protein